MAVAALDLRARYRGALLGLAAGDALGTTLEFRAPGTFEPLDDLVGGGPFRLPAGAWTDDTSMALCLAESLLACGGFDPADQMRRYVRWWHEGHLSSTGTCFDIGNTVRQALARFERTGDPWSGSTAPKTAGNGSLMRLAPVVLAFAPAPAEAIRLAGESSRTTHGAREAIDACRYFAALLIGALAVEGRPPAGPVLTGVGSLERTAAVTARRRGGIGLVPAARAARHPRDRLRRRVPRGRPLGSCARGLLSYRRAARGEPGERRRYDGRGVRPARGRLLG